MMPEQLRLKARDKNKGMTLLELARFTQTAIDLGLDLRTPISAFVGWRAQVKELIMQMKPGN